MHVHSELRFQKNESFTFRIPNKIGSPNIVARAKKVAPVSSRKEQQTQRNMCFLSTLMHNNLLNKTFSYFSSDSSLEGCNNLKHAQ